MCGLWLSGRLGHELMKYQIRGWRPASSPSTWSATRGW